MGLAEIRRKIMLKKVKEKKKLEIMLREFEEISKRIEEVSEMLKKFEKKWGKYLSQNEEIRKALASSLLGIDLSMFSKSLDVSNLAIEILSLAKEEDISIIPLSHLVTLLSKKISGIPVDLKAVEKAINHLKKKKLIQGIFEINGIKYVRIKDPKEDIDNIIRTFVGKEYITIDDVVSKLGWDVTRAELTLEEMVKRGLAVKEDYPRRYWLVK